MMGPLDWAFLPLQRYATFHGRAPRAEYWWFWLLQMALTIVTRAIDGLLGLGVPGSPISTSLMVGLALFVPSLAVTVRRLHDINRSGWTVLVYAVMTAVAAMLGVALSLVMGPFGIVLMAIGVAAVSIKFIVLMASEGSRGDNGYGGNPYGLTYGY